ELHAPLYRRQGNCAGLVLYVAFSVQNFKDTPCRSRRLRHQRNYEPQLPHRKEDENDIHAELLVAAEVEAVKQNLLAGKIEQHGLPKLHDQKDRRKQERERPPDLEALGI